MIKGNLCSIKGVVLMGEFTRCPSMLQLHYEWIIKNVLTNLNKYRMTTSFLKWCVSRMAWIAIWYLSQKIWICSRWFTNRNDGQLGHSIMKHSNGLQRVFRPLCLRNTRNFIRHTKTHIFLWPLLLTWINNHMPCKVWDEITYPFLNFNGATVEV